MSHLTNMKNIKSLSMLVSTAMFGALFLSGCSSDDGYTRKVRGTDEYLNAPAPKMLNVPAPITLPSHNTELEIALPAQQGSFGFDVDITPPSVGLTSADAASEAQLAQDSYSENLYQGSVNVVSGSDDTGLPVIIVEQGFDATWQSLSNVLGKAGFNITDQNEALAKLTVEFSGTGSSSMPNSQIKSGEYILQVGDLGNRTSLQFRNSDNTYLTQSQNDVLQKLLQSFFNQ